MLFDLKILAVYLVAISIASYLSFYLDKNAAIKKGRRISENTLLMIAFFGGSIGAIIGQQRLRHKTYKQPFKTFLYAIIGFQIILLASITVWLSMKP